MKLAQESEAAAVVDPAGTESDGLEQRDAGRATPTPRRAHVELETDEGKGEGEST